MSRDEGPREKLARMFGESPPLAEGAPGWRRDAVYADEGIDPGGLHVTLRDARHSIIRRWTYQPSAWLSGWRFRRRIRMAKRLIDSNRASVKVPE